MSSLSLTVCDNCGREARAGQGTYQTEYDPDLYDGWCRIHITGAGGGGRFDFCRLQCLKEWAAKSIKEMWAVLEMERRV